MRKMNAALKILVGLETLYLINLALLYDNNNDGFFDQKVLIILKYLQDILFNFLRENFGIWRVKKSFGWPKKISFIGKNNSNYAQKILKYAKICATHIPPPPCQNKLSRAWGWVLTMKVKIRAKQNPRKW